MKKILRRTIKIITIMVCNFISLVEHFWLCMSWAGYGGILLFLIPVIYAIFLAVLISIIKKANFTGVKDFLLKMTVHIATPILTLIVAQLIILIFGIEIPMA